MQLHFITACVGFCSQRLAVASKMMFDVGVGPADSALSSIPYIDKVCTLTLLVYISATANNISQNCINLGATASNI